MLLGQVDTFEIFRPKMDASKEVLHAIATFQADISPVFPYLNAELGGWDYDRPNQVLLLKLSAGKWITLHAHKIAIRGTGTWRKPTPCSAGSQARSTTFMNAGNSSSPRYTSQAGLRVMEILKLLPMTNCKACGYATCMAYAAALREGEITPDDCPPVWQEQYGEKRGKLQSYLARFGWRALDE